MKRSRLIVLAIIGLYLAALWAAWRFSTERALEKTIRLLEQSERVFVESCSDSVDAALFHTCMEISSSSEIDGDRLTGEYLNRLSETHMVEEINFVDTNGVCIASTDPQIVGFDFRTSKETAEFMKLLDGCPVVRQPFRRGVANPAEYRKYLGMPVNGIGFIQVGMDFKWLGQVLEYYDSKELLRWKIGRSGHYDKNYPEKYGKCFDLSDGGSNGRILRMEDNGRTVYVRAFGLGGYSYVSVLPEDEYFGERNLNFVIMAVMLGMATVFFVWFVIASSRSAQRDLRHRAAEEMVRRRDLEMARSIQLSSLPAPDIYRKNEFAFTFSAATHPAKEVGGDFYDFYRADKARMVFVIADAAGKGISAAMFMMRARNEIYNAIGTEHDLALAIANANERLCGNNSAQLFVTAWIGVLDIRSGEIEYVNAGHNYPFVRRADGTVDKIKGKGGRFLGMFPGVGFRVNHLVLKPGDALFMYTDGITEAMDGSSRLFGERRLTGALAVAEPVPEAMIESVNSAVGAFVGAAEQSDDLTSIAIVWHGDPKPSSITFVSEEASLGSAMDWLGKEIGLSVRNARSRLLNAADEMMTNIVNYSGAKEFSMTVENAPGRTRLVFSDSGRAYNPLSHADPDTHASLQDRPIGGIGILMTKRLVDVVHYQREGGRNVLTLVKLDG